MSLGGVVEVAISLVFMYLLLSLICTTINEMIATFASLRGRNLSTAMSKLLENSPELIERFYSHGLIKGQMAVSHGPGFGDFLVWIRSLFRRKSTSAVASPATSNPGPSKPNPNNSARPAPADHSSYIDSKSFATALLGSLDKDKPVPVFDDIKGALALAEIPTGIKQVLESALATANNDVNKVRDNIADWFDAAMDRLEGNYKRQLRWLSFMVGLAVAIVLNGDTIAVGKAVWKDEALRQQIVQSAEDHVKNTPAVCSPSGADASKDIECRMDQLVNQVDRLRPIPIGWGDSTLASQDTSFLTKGGGIFLTALALSLGAPFWFDVLAKFMTVRGAGKKPPKAQETKKDTTAEKSDKDKSSQSAG